MSQLDKDFAKAQEDVKTLSSRPDNATMLSLYALYKQGSEGDNTTKKPGGFDFVGKAKWDAWAGKEGMSQDEAKQAYIDLVQELLDEDA